MATVQQIKDLLDQQKAELLEEFDTKLEAAVKPLRISVSILTAKHANACLARAEKLVKVPRPDGTPPTGAYPETILNLLVVGNEKLPDGTTNTWNKKKSHALLKQYDADMGDMSDGENEHTELSRTRRLKLARVLGVSQAQLNYAQLSL